MFNFSNFLKDSKSYDNQNKMAVGKMKLEYREIPINKFAGLKSKGVNIATEFDELRETLFN